MYMEYQARLENLAKLLADSKTNLDVVRGIASRVTQLNRCLEYTKELKKKFETTNIRIDEETAQDVVLRLERIHREYRQRQRQYQQDYTDLIAEQKEAEAFSDDIRYAAIREAETLPEDDTFRTIAAMLGQTTEISDKNRADLKVAKQMHGLEG